MAYNSTRGDPLTSTFELRDLTYDGEVTDLYSSNGLGVLNDGSEGDSSFALKVVMCFVNIIQKLKGKYLLKH